MTAYRFTGIASGLILGIILATYTAITIPVVVLLLLLILGAVVLTLGWRAERRWIEWPRMIIFLAGLALSLPLGYSRTQHVLEPSHPETLRSRLNNFEDGDLLILRGIIDSEPEWRGSGAVDITMRVQNIRSEDSEEADGLPVSSGKAQIRVFAYRTSRQEAIDHLHELALPKSYGNEIEVQARYNPIDPPLNPHAFDYGAFLRQSGIDTSMRCHASRVEILNERTGNPLTALALRTKTRFLETFKRSIRAPASRVAAASTLGVRRSVEGVTYRGFDIADMFRHAGVGHVLAVSGLHVSVIAVLLFALFRMTGTSPRVFVPPLIFFLILFALLTGARPSAVRAVVMNSVILFTIAYFRCNLRTATAIGLSASAFIILLNNPLLLFAPSFLLSYGAVLSLIVLAPPFDRFLCTLRGFSAIFFLIWFAMLIGIAGWRFYWLTHPVNILALGGFLWILVLIGSRLNHAMPRMWQIGFSRVPAILRLFIAAQLAIQIGMMLPLSAWFFGRFPVAGVLINLIAIPTVGILVQLGMLVGLIGLLPIIGPTLALPFGSATALIGEMFLGIAYIGARLFPFPATPQPTVWQLILYYGIVAGILILEQNRHIILDHIYRLPLLAPKHAKHMTIAVTTAAVILVALPWALRPRSLPTATHMQILAADRYPLVTIHGRNRADLVNAGNQFQGSRLLFDHLRAKGSVTIGNVFLPAPDPRAGIEGTAALAETLPITSAWLPVIPADGETFTKALGDDYLIQSAEEGQAWATNYDEAYDELLHAHVERRNPRHLQTIHEWQEADWDNVKVTPLPRFTGTVSRFLTSAQTPLIHADINGISWIVITDTIPEALSEARGHMDTCHVILVSDISSRAPYFRWLREAVEQFAPEILIIGGEDKMEWSAEQEDWLQQQKEDGLQVLHTGTDGAIMAKLPRTGGMHLQTYRSKRELVLHPDE